MVHEERDKPQRAKAEPIQRQPLKAEEQERPRSKPSLEERMKNDKQRKRARID